MQLAVAKGRVVCGVKRWESDNSTFQAYNAQGALFYSKPYDRLFALIGYGPDHRTIGNLGCKWNDKIAGVAVDFDGEVLMDPSNPDPAKRIAQGHFVYGAMGINNAFQNNGVIPGMIHGIGDLLFGVLMRALQTTSES